MRLHSRRALLSLAVAAGLICGTAVAAGAATVAPAPQAVVAEAPVAVDPATGAPLEGRPAQTTDAQTADAQAAAGTAAVPKGKLPERGLRMPGQGGTAGTTTTVSVPATVSAPVFGAASISGSMATPRAGVQLVAEQQIGGAWTQVGTATTDSTGKFRFSTAGGDGRLGTFTVRIRSTDPSVSAAGDPSVLVTRRFGDPHQKLSDAQVRTVFRNHGLTWWSSGNCSDRSRSNCTSFDQMRASTVTETITLQQKSGCSILVTGGTEVGHAAGTYSHYNGYKIDYQMSSCITSWVLRNGRSIGGSKWTVGSTVYYNERNHWDIQTRP